MKVVAFVPIRLNSKRVAGKNLKLLGNKPLMCYILEALERVKDIDEVYCYCSNEKIREYLPKGVSFLKRPECLDRDETLGKEIYEAFTQTIEADVYVLAHATSPFTKTSTIENALKKVVSGENDSAFSVKKIQTFCWYMGKPLNYDLQAIPRTQTIEPVYEETSAFFVFTRNVWKKHKQRIGFKPYMSVMGNIESLDIDWPDDFDFAEKIIEAAEMHSTKKDK